ncbi:MAG: PDZ domain-containing protein [Frankiaceae bacterium]|nr:PDZ domain-containing protein [Frankiaceae bacterium]
MTDTLGTVQTGSGGNAETAPVISISGAKTQTSSGHLYLTTVQSLPCGTRPTLWEAIKGWFDDHDAVEPYEVECPPNENPSQVQAQEARQMSESQSHAVIAAFTELGYTSTGNRVVVGSVTSSVPAAKVLRRGDVIESVDGKPVRTATRLVAIIQATTPPGPLPMVILRDGKRLTLSVRTVTGDTGKTMVGFAPRIAPTFNHVVATIGINPRVIGGPSAGTALALGIIDKLTPGGLTGGRTIAGTGTVSSTGKVGEIGGIQQKIAAAAAAHATVFFAPAAECGDAKSAAPATMTLVAVKTLHDAVTSLQAIKSGSTDFPHC